MTLADYQALNLPVIDTHVHLWDTDLMTYPWLDEVTDIRKTLTLPHFHEATAGLNLHKLVFMQCECLPEQYTGEIAYITRLAENDPRLQGIISWFPLSAENAEELLDQLVQNPLVKGIRRLEEIPHSLYKNPDFIRNLSLLPKYNLSFDICVKSQQLPGAIHLVDKQPDIAYILDHLGKPDILHQEFQPWADHIRILAQNPNVYCKLSGMVTEAHLQHWTTDGLRPYLDYAAEQFGSDRLVYGGDWPVVTLAASYHTWFETFLSLCTDFSTEDLQKLLSKNAEHFYKL